MEEDDWFTSSARDVRLEPLFEEQLRDLGVDPQKLEAALAGLDISVAKHPEIFPKAPNTPFSMAKLIIYPDAPPLRVFFTYTAVQVRLIYVEFAED